MTLRRLQRRAEACRYEQWCHTSAMLAMIANCRAGRTKNSRTVRPEQLNPLATRARVKREPMTMKQFMRWKRKIKKGVKLR